MVRDPQQPWHNAPTCVFITATSRAERLQAQSGRQVSRSSDLLIECQIVSRPVDRSHVAKGLCCFCLCVGELADLKDQNNSNKYAEDHIYHIRLRRVCRVPDAAAAVESHLLSTYTHPRCRTHCKADSRGKENRSDDSAGLLNGLTCEGASCFLDDEA